MSSLILIAVLLILVAFAVRSISRSRKKGGCSGCCSSCSGCSRK